MPPANGEAGPALTPPSSPASAPPPEPRPREVIKLFELQEKTVPELKAIADALGLQELGALQRHRIGL